MKAINQKRKSSIAAIDKYQDEILSGLLTNTYLSISTMDTSQEFLNNVQYDTNRNNDLRSRLVEFTEGETEFVIEFAKYISSNLNYLKVYLPDYFKDINIDALSDITHRLKPAMEILGEPELLILLRDIKNEWKDGVYNQEKINEVIEKIGRYQSELAAIIN